MQRPPDVGGYRLAVTRTAGIVCGKHGFGCTVVDGKKVEDHDIEVPANITERGAQLSWLADEAQRLIQKAGCKPVCIQQAAGGGMYGASSERHEVEAAVQIGAHEAAVETRRLTREGVRAAMGLQRAKGAYETLLKRDDVRARSNAQRRDQYLLALAIKQ